MTVPFIWAQDVSTKGIDEQVWEFGTIVGKLLMILTAQSSQVLLEASLFL